MTPEEFMDYVEKDLGIPADAVELFERVVCYAWDLRYNGNYKSKVLHELLDNYEGITPDMIDDIEF